MLLSITYPGFRSALGAAQLDWLLVPLTILKYLLAYRCGRPVSQDYLMGWLWHESDPKWARWSLNSAVHALC